MNESDMKLLKINRSEERHGERENICAEQAVLVFFLIIQNIFLGDRLF